MQDLLIDLNKGHLISPHLYNICRDAVDTTYFQENDLKTISRCKSKRSLVFRHAPDKQGARCSSVVRVFAHGAMGRRIDPSCGEPIELFLVPASAPRLV